MASVLLHETPVGRLRPPLFPSHPHYQPEWMPSIKRSWLKSSGKTNSSHNRLRWQMPAPQGRSSRNNYTLFLPTFGSERTRERQSRLSASANLIGRREAASPAHRGELRTSKRMLIGQLHNPRGNSLPPGDALASHRRGVGNVIAARAKTPRAKTYRSVVATTA